MSLLRQPVDYALFARALACSLLFPRVVVFGDSRTKPVALKGALKICFGGAGIRDFGRLIPLIVRIARPRRVIVALGLNDARSRAQPPKVTAFGLGHMLRNVPEVVLLEPWPLEPGKQYSARFDPGHLAQLGIALREIAAKKGWRFVPAPSQCETCDGAHFTARTQMQWDELVANQVSDISTKGISFTASH